MSAPFGMRANGLRAEVSTPRAPRRCIGVNYVDLFSRGISTRNFNRKHGQDLRRLVDAGIPFARFSASPFWPNEWKESYFGKADDYHKHLGEVFAAAADVGFRLAPTLVGAPWSLSDALEEPVSAWERSQSRTRAFFRDYVAGFVERHKSCAAIWFWEAFNEFNSFADFPGSEKWWPPIGPAQGAPATRGGADEITSEGQAGVLAEFAEIVLRADPTRRISSGSNVPRPNAFKSFRNLLGVDTREEFRKAILRATPKRAAIASIHLYEENENKYFEDRRSSFRELLDQFVIAAREAGVPTFLGEFGIRRSGDSERDQQRLSRLVDDIVAAHVDYAALWVYDFSYQNSSFNVTFSNDRREQLAVIAKANEGLRQ